MTKPTEGFEIDTTENDDHEAETLAELEGLVAGEEPVAPPNPLGRPLLYRLRSYRSKKTGKLVAMGPFMKTGGLTEEGRRLPSVPVSQPYFEVLDTDPDFEGQKHKFELVPGQLSAEEREIMEDWYRGHAEERAAHGKRARQPLALTAEEAAEKATGNLIDRKMRAFDRKIDKLAEAIPEIVAKTVAASIAEVENQKKEPPKGGSGQK